MEKYGASFSLLLDLPRKKTFFHDDSVSGEGFEEAADLLIDPSRDEKPAHAVFIKDPGQRSDVIEFLRSLQTDSPRDRPLA